MGLSLKEQEDGRSGSHFAQGMARQTALQEQGVQVRRRFALTRTLSVRCNGQTALRLAKLAWVKRIEPDRPVKALGR